jgi:hypothetical protein
MIVGYDYTLAYLDAIGEAEIRSVTAAYFVTDGDLVLFKEIDHKVIFAVHKARVIAIKRGSSVTESSSPA